MSILQSIEELRGGNVPGDHPLNFTHRLCRSGYFKQQDLAQALSCPECTAKRKAAVASGVNMPTALVSSRAAAAANKASAKRSASKPSLGVTTLGGGDSGGDWSPPVTLGAGVSAGAAAGVSGTLAKPRAARSRSQSQARAHAGTAKTKTKRGSSKRREADSATTSPQETPGADSHVAANADADADAVAVADAAASTTMLEHPWMLGNDLLTSPFIGRPVSMPLHAATGGAMPMLAVAQLGAAAISAGRRWVAVHLGGLPPAHAGAPTPTACAQEGALLSPPEPSPHRSPSRDGPSATPIRALPRPLPTFSPTSADLVRSMNGTLPRAGSAAASAFGAPAGSLPGRGSPSVMCASAAPPTATSPAGSIPPAWTPRQHKPAGRGDKRRAAQSSGVPLPGARRHKAARSPLAGVMVEYSPLPLPPSSVPPGSSLPLVLSHASSHMIRTSFAGEAAGAGAGAGAGVAAGADPASGTLDAVHRSAAAMSVQRNAVGSSLESMMNTPACWGSALHDLLAEPGILASSAEQQLF